MLLSLLQVLETQEDVLQLLPHALRLLHSGLAAVSQEELQSGSLTQSLTVAVQAAVVGGTVSVSALAPLQQLLWMLEAPQEKVLQAPGCKPQDASRHGNSSVVCSVCGFRLVVYLLVSWIT